MAEGVGGILFAIVAIIGWMAYHEIRDERHFPWGTAGILLAFLAIAFFVWTSLF